MSHLSIQQRFTLRFLAHVFAVSATCLLINTACSMLRSTPTPPPTSTPLPTATRRTLPTSTPEPLDTGWQPLSPGLEWRRLKVQNSGGSGERLQLVRLNPNQIRLRVIYQPSHPRRISEWATALPHALLIINAGYFTPQMQTTGLIISDGRAFGRPYDDFAGMLAVTAQDQITLRWLKTWPYRSDEALVQAVQSFPVLVKPGRVMGFPADADQGQRARRTVIAQDTTGHLILLVSPNPYFSLHELAVWLTESDLELDIALNLDGGTSTGLWIRGHDEPIDSWVPVPAVIVVEPAG